MNNSYTYAIQIMDFSLFRTSNTLVDELLIHTFLSTYTTRLRVYYCRRLNFQALVLLYFAIAIQMPPVRSELSFKTLEFPNFRPALAAKKRSFQNV